ncbi:MAG: methionine synthase I, partial [Litoreibacter sp.]|nr:methionine synthase I [Litoreibacter sp.]
MGIIGNLLAGGGVRGVGQAIEGVAGAFRPNANKQLELEHEAFRAALGQFGAEFAKTGPGAFDRFVNALNRLPRPLLAFSTLGLFGFAMADPDAFSRRMVGLERVPEPLWWLLGAIVSFYFGARELHYARSPRRSGE